MTVEARDQATTGESESLRLVNLLNDAGTLAELLIDASRTGGWLDAYLLTAGLDQILEDALHPDLLALHRIAKRLRTRDEGAPRRAAARAAAGGRAAVWRAHSVFLAASKVSRCQLQTSALLADLAGVVELIERTGGGRSSPPPETKQDLQRRAALLRQAVDALPERVRRTPLRLPSCFLNLDQSPRDIMALVEEAVRRWPDRRHPTLVLGVRTSGSYLAPIATASLRAAGFRAVRQMTIRPGQLWLPSERATLRWAVEAGARVLLMDDPPNTWGTFAETVRLLSSLGFPRDSVVLTVQTFPGTAPRPGALARHPAVVLPWEQTEVSRRLDPAAVRDALEGLLEEGARVERVERMPFAAHEGARAHAGAQYGATIRREGRETETRVIYVEGVGLGYFGMHALAVGQPLQEFLPELFGVSGGLLFREWLPEDSRLAEAAEFDAAGERIAAYVHRRTEALAVPEDVSLRLKDRSSVRRALSRFLAQPFGRMEIAVWPFTGTAVRALLAVARPSVVDARTGIGSWFRYGRNGREVRKITFFGRAFSGFDMFCYDAVYDLAGVAASSESNAVEERLLSVYAARTDQEVDPERWLLYQLVHLSGQDLEWEELSDPELERRMSKRIRRYLAKLFLQDTGPPRAGPLCAVDVDGVLESTPLGISATGARGVRALRAMQKHGYRPVLVSGRSISDVRQRCIDYRLSGGVGEYGAGVYLAGADRTFTLLTRDEVRTLATVREVLKHAPGIALDEGYGLAVRAYRLDGRGRRRALRAEQRDAALAVVERGSVRDIEGQAQTDFMVTRVTKATGVEALAAELQAGGHSLALAVGDTASDLPMLELADLAFGPANAHPELRERGIRILHRSCEAGLEEACAHLLGHRPGGCHVCRNPQLPARSRLLLALLESPSRRSWPSKAAWALSTLARLIRLSRAVRLEGHAAGSGAAVPPPYLEQPR